MRLTQGCVIRQHNGDEEGYTDVARVIWIERAANAYWCIPMPEMSIPKDDEKEKHGRKKHFIKAVRLMQLDVTENDERLTCHDAEAPAVWSLTEEELSGERSPLLAWKTRRQLQNWKAKRDEQYALIAPIVEKLDTRDLVDPNLTEPQIRLQQARLGLRSSAAIVRALRMYLLGGSIPNALLPRWDLCNAVGEPKHSRVHADGVRLKPGRKNQATIDGVVGKAGLVLSLKDRDNLAKGYKFHKKAGVSVERAWHLTLAQFYLKSYKFDGATGIEVSFVEPHPSLKQFQRHGPTADPATQAARINLGSHRYQRNARGLRGSARDGIIAAGQYSLIDATADDQNLVSSADPLRIVSTPWHSKVMEGYTGYISGIHSGFEHPSTMTSLMAIAHAAGPKEEYCARYGIELQPGEWMAVSSAIVRHDHGELKSARGIKVLEDSEVTTEFVRSYAAELKGPVESAHNSIARHGSHQMAASNQGIKRKRGDEDHAKNACLTYADYMPHFIRTILIHNNVERVDGLLTDEMRRDGVKPFRGEILKWMLEKGYAKTEPANMELLRKRCLPRLQGSIEADGVHVFDPRENRVRKIDGMVFWSQELGDRLLTERGRKKVIPCEIHLNPSDLSQAWLVHEPLIHLKLRHVDPERAQRTLKDWLDIDLEERRARFAAAQGPLEAKASHNVSMEDTNRKGLARARKARRDARAAGSKPAGASKANKREATVAEKQHQANTRLGLVGPSKPEARAPRRPAPAQVKTSPAVDQDDDFMVQLRARKAA